MIRGPRAPLHCDAGGAIAQLGERLDRTQEVAGSSPASSMKPPDRKKAHGYIHALGLRMHSDLLATLGVGRELRNSNPRLRREGRYSR